MWEFFAKYFLHGHFLFVGGGFSILWCYLCGLVLIGLAGSHYRVLGGGDRVGFERNALHRLRENVKFYHALSNQRIPLLTT